MTEHLDLTSVGDEPEATDRPVLLTVDDDPAVSRAVARDLRRQYGEHLLRRAAAHHMNLCQVTNPLYAALRRAAACYCVN